MSKEMNVVENPLTEAPEIAVQPEVVQLSGLSLAMIGGGMGDVAF